MAEGNIEVTVTWAPADSVRMLLERAASMLTGYGELIRRDGASHVEEHHYVPEVEHVAAELRALMDATPRTCGQLGMAVVDAADAERFRWLAEHTVATGLARWVHPFQFLAEAVDARRKAASAVPRVTTAAELRQQAKSDTSCVGAFARARPGKA